MREVDVRVVQAKTDEACLESLIKDCEAYILGTVARITGSYADKSDDRWSVALSAFHEAVTTYDYDRGSFFPYAETVIRHRIYDYERKEKRESAIAVDPADLPQIGGVVQGVQEDVLLEIEAVKRILEQYNINFSALADASPKAGKTKKACAKAIRFSLTEPILIEEMKRTKMLPLKIIEKNTGVTPKILDRHRKYIIAGIIILSGDYPVLSEYFRHIKEGR
jgi:RNA polymerase sigma factor